MCFNPLPASPVLLAEKGEASDASEEVAIVSPTQCTVALLEFDVRICTYIAIKVCLYYVHNMWMCPFLYGWLVAQFVCTYVSQCVHL